MSAPARRPRFPAHVTPRPSTIGRRGQTGIALVAVMWMVTALALLATALATDSRSEVRTAQAARAFAEAAATGDAAIELAVLQLRGASAAALRHSTLGVEMDGRRVEVVVAPASGFIDLNRADEGLLRDLFLYGAGLDAELAATLAQRIVDWRDPDQSPLPRGAEDETYAAAGLRQRTRGGPFETPEDLLQVLGLTFDTYDKVTKLATPYGAAQRVDPLAAGNGVLRVLARGDAAAADRIAAARDAGDKTIDMSPLTQDHLQPSTAGTRYRLEARVRDADGRLLARARWVDLGARGAGGRPWRTLRVEPVRALDSGANPDGV